MAMHNLPKKKMSNIDLTDIDEINLADERVMNSIIQALKTAGKVRTMEELKLIRNALAYFPYLNTLIEHIPNETIENLLRELSFERHSKGSTIFCFGDTPKLFYSILKGSVYILLKKIDRPTHETSSTVDDNNNHGDIHKKTKGSSKQANDGFKINNKRTRNTSKREIPNNNNNHHGLGHIPDIASLASKVNENVKLISSQKSNTASSMESYRLISNSFVRSRGDDECYLDNMIYNQDEIYESYPDHRIANVLYEKDHFGEIALVHNVLRTATIVSREETYTINLKGSAFKLILGNYHKDLMKQKIKFFKSISILSEWPSQQIEGLLRVARLMTYRKDHVLFDEHKLADEIYIIFSGEVELTKYMSINIKDKSFDHPDKYNKEIYYEVKGAMADINKIWQNELERSMKKRIKVALLGPGQVFGDEDILLGNYNEKRREYKATVMTESSQIYVIKIDSFLQNSNSLRTLNAISNIQKVKLDWRGNIGKASLSITSMIGINRPKSNDNNDIMNQTFSEDSMRIIDQRNDKPKLNIERYIKTIGAIGFQLNNTRSNRMRSEFSTPKHDQSICGPSSYWNTKANSTMVSKRNSRRTSTFDKSMIQELPSKDKKAKFITFISKRRSTTSKSKERYNNTNYHLGLGFQLQRQLKLYKTEEYHPENGLNRLCKANGIKIPNISFDLTTDQFLTKSMRKSQADRIKKIKESEISQGFNHELVLQDYCLTSKGLIEKLCRSKDMKDFHHKEIIGSLDLVKTLRLKKFTERHETPSKEQYKLCSSPFKIIPLVSNREGC